MRRIVRVASHRSTHCSEHTFKPWLLRPPSHAPGAAATVPRALSCSVRVPSQPTVENDDVSASTGVYKLFSLTRRSHDARRQRNFVQKLCAQTYKWFVGIDVVFKMDRQWSTAGHKMLKTSCWPRSSVPKPNSFHSMQSIFV